MVQKTRRLAVWAKNICGQRSFRNTLNPKSKSATTMGFLGCSLAVARKGKVRKARKGGRSQFEGLRAKLGEAEMHRNKERKGLVRTQGFVT